ncbi:MAG TPA: ribosome small subunit-dependent GTPase A [Oligoflexia bacterium]|nr:ribosome small subunit-dependent GTPase A [Oligoflexia bacterium]HMP27448.1 ribosome small subunit-dependent GTPase A [Oligoflexia bacterium]
MKNLLSEQSATEGLVIWSSGQKSKILTTVGFEVLASPATRSISPLVGDRVVLKRSAPSAWTVTSLLERRSLYKRSYRGRVKELAANIDQLLIVVAPVPKPNFLTIDRMIVEGLAQGIKIAIIFNKVDIKSDFLSQVANTYQGFMPLIQTNTIFDSGLNELRSYLRSGGVNSLTALCGVSGVGKSALIKKLCLSAELEVGDLSKKSSQGKQTTSLAKIYRCFADGLDQEIWLLDLPGVQNFGLSHLSYEKVLLGFPDFREFLVNCEFPRSCKHTAERECGIKQAVLKGEIKESRYKSYLHILNELVENQSFIWQSKK